MDWFEKLTGFREKSYDETRKLLRVADNQLQSQVNRRRYQIGKLRLISLQELRGAARSKLSSSRLRYSTVVGDVRHLHKMPEYRGALFQVASQFNMLEMIGPDVTPEHGVTRYEQDHTQGPACAIAAGAATIFRNYFAPVGDQIGQTALHQLNGLAHVGEALSLATGIPIDQLWSMRNGYALCTRDGLSAISEWLHNASEDSRDELRSLLGIGLHTNVEVTDGIGELVGPLVSQAFCSALPVAYSELPAAAWKPFAELVLEAACEATLWAGVLNTQHNSAGAGSNIVLLTRLGGGAFGNKDTWIDHALRRALQVAQRCNLDVRLVEYR